VRIFNSCKCNKCAVLKNPSLSSLQNVESTAGVAADAADAAPSPSPSSSSPPPSIPQPISRQSVLVRRWERIPRGPAMKHRTTEKAQGKCLGLLGRRKEENLGLLSLSRPSPSFFSPSSSPSSSSDEANSAAPSPPPPSLLASLATHAAAAKSPASRWSHVSAAAPGDDANSEAKALTLGSGAEAATAAAAALETAPGQKSRAARR